MAAPDRSSVDDGFPRLQADTVFVATPSDLAGLRAQVERVVRRMANESGAQSQLQPYSWDLVFDPDGPGFDQRFAMQRQIPRPADPLCRGVVCLLAERIGSPLDDAFPLQLCEGARAWQDPAQKYRLQHPWPKSGDEQRALLDQGAFPLTGTTWEFLDAVTASAPVFLGFIADRHVDAEDPAVKFGRGLLYESFASHGFQAHKAWVERTYEPQVRALRNFVGAVVAHGIDVRTRNSEDDLIAAVRAFVWTAVLKQGADAGRTPFKGLAHYDIEDGDVFHGRGHLSDSIIRDFDELAQHDESANAIGLIGVSGAGKSSALRAGVLYRLQARAQRGRYHVMAVRPTDFQNESGEPENIVQKLLLHYVRSTAISVPSQRLVEALSARAHQVARAAVDLIAETLPAALDGRQSKLVIGLDQLEEIVDDLMSPVSARAWRPLLDFLAEARKGESILFVYTLEATRRDAIGKTPLASLVDELRQYAVANGPEFWREIVTQPFRTAGITLDETVRKKLYDCVDSLTRNKASDETGALLPLVALTLSKIYAKAKSRAEVLKREASPRGFGAPPPESKIGMETFVADDFRVEQAIANEATAVVSEFWKMPGGKPARDDVSALLRPFVRLTEGADDAVTLRAAAIPSYGPEYGIVTAFLAKRLAVRVDSQVCRLVHEALLHNWEPAREWLATAGDELRSEGQMRASALAWDRAGRGKSRLEATPERIDVAADLLSSYWTAWCDGAAVIESDRVLRDFCLELLGQSSVPSAVVLSSSMQSTHAFLAAAYGRVDILEAFDALDRPALGTARAGDRRTPMYAAAAFVQPEAVAYLLSRHVSAIGETNDTHPIAGAIVGGCEKSFDLLLPHYTKAELGGDPDEWSALYLCATHGRASMARRLVEDTGVDADRRCGLGGTPLHAAVRQGHTDLAALLLPLTDATLTDASGRTPLHVAAETGNADLVELLLSRYDPSQAARDGMTGARDGWTALHCAVYARMVTAVRCLLADPRTDPNAAAANGDTPLSLAADEPAIRADVLEDARIAPWQPIDTQGATAIEIALTLHKWPLCLRMLRRGAPAASTVVDSYRLFRAALVNHAPSNVLAALVAQLCERANAPNANGKTALMAAAERGGRDAIDLLIREANADPTHASPRDGTALQVAVTRGRGADVLEALWAGTRSELGLSDSQGWTPLHVAAVAGDAAVGQWLLAKGGAGLADARDRWNRTPADLGPPAWNRALFGENTVDVPPSRDSWQQGMQWAALDGAERQKVQAAIDGLDNPLRRSPRTRYDWTNVSFHPPARVRLLRLSDPDWPIDLHAYYYVLRSPDTELRLFHLNGASAPLHDVNEAVSLALGPDEACDYLRFFCYFCHGDEGAFVIAESAQQREIPPQPEQPRIELEKRVRVARNWGWSEQDSAYRLSAVVYYGTGLFFADFLLQPNGGIDMVNDQPLLPMPRPIAIDIA